MKIGIVITRNAKTEVQGRCLIASCFTRLLPLLFLTLPVAVQAQVHEGSYGPLYWYEMYEGGAYRGKVEIGGYDGSVGAVSIPSEINGMPVVNIGYRAFYLNSQSLTSLVIPDSVTNIARDAVLYCQNLTSVTIGSGVVSIGASAFYLCRSLTSVTIPDSVISIGGWAFEQCYNLTSVTIGNGVTTIGDGAFNNCRSLTSVTIPDSVISIGDLAFSDCHKLTKVYFYGNAPQMGLNVFLRSPYPVARLTLYRPPWTTGWPLLSDYYQIDWDPPPFIYVTMNGKATITKYVGPGGAVTLPSTIDGMSVTSIGSKAFYLHTNLTSVTIGSGVTNIGPRAFESCTDLMGVYFQGNAPSVDPTAFDGSGNVVVYYLEVTTGWDATFGGRPTAIWPNQPPVITKRSPAANPPAISEGASVAFSVTASDSTDPNQWTRGMSNITWHVDGTQKLETRTGAPNAITSAFTFKTTAATVLGAAFGDVQVRAVALDKYGATTQVVWTVRVNNIIAAQAISFPLLPMKGLEDPDFSPGATTSSGLPITYTSSNESVAQILGDMIHIAGAGTAVITARQPGNTDYRAAVAVEKTLTVKARLSVEVPDGGGTVAGGGLYAAGVKVNLTARSATGNTFLRWNDGSQIAARSIVMPGTNVLFSAYFCPTAAVPAPVVGDPGAQRAMVGALFDLPLSITSGCLPTVTVTGLPSGLRYDAVQRKIVGVPLLAVPGKVILINARNTAGKAALQRSFTLAVDPLPPWACGTFNGWCEVGNDAGVATMTVTSKGKVTGKLSAGGSNYVFNALSYAAGSNPADGFSLACNAVAGRSVVPLTLVVHPPEASGPDLLSVADGSGVVMYRNVWKDADMLATATNLNGYFTATLPDLAAPGDASDSFGSGYLAFTVLNGTVKTAGKLADGTVVSLSGTLLADSSDSRFTVLYSSPTLYKGGCLFGVAEFIDPPDGPAIIQSWDGEAFAWENRNPMATAVYTNSGFERELSLVGGWYSKLGDLRAYYTNAPLSVGAGDNAPESEIIVGTNRYDSVCWNPDGLPLTIVTNRLGEMTGIAAPRVGLPVKTGANWNYDATNTIGLTFALTRATGVFKGGFKAWFDYGTRHTSKTVLFEGILTPERENLADGIEGRGFFLWPDKSRYENSHGITVWYPFNWSYDFVIRP